MKQILFLLALISSSYSLHAQCSSDKTPALQIIDHIKTHPDEWKVRLMINGATVKATGPNNVSFLYSISDQGQGNFFVDRYGVSLTGKGLGIDKRLRGAELILFRREVGPIIEELLIDELLTQNKQYKDIFCTDY